MALLGKVRFCSNNVVHQMRHKPSWKLVSNACSLSQNFKISIRLGSFSVWPSALYEKMSITGEKKVAIPAREKLPGLEEKPDRGMLFIIGAPSLPKKEPRKTHTANTLMVNTADHPCYCDLQVDCSAKDRSQSKK